VTFTLRKVLLSAAVAAAPTLLARVAHAQMPSVDPGGRAPVEEDTSTGSGGDSGGGNGGGGFAEPTVITIGPDGQPIAPAPVEDPHDFYHYEGSADLYAYDEPTVIHSGPLPDLHVVRRGDTLWDICWYYFNDPWQWPKIWSFNPTITNPHWIYPGDLVRLLPAGMGGGDLTPLPDDVEGSDDPDFEPPPARKYDVRLRQVAFVSQQDLDDTIKIDGSVEEKELLAEGDAVYLSYPDDKPPQVGTTYTIYEDDQPVTHPRSGDKVGAFVRILGELRVTSVKEDKRARAVIVDANREIERGALVGPLIRQLKTVSPVPNQVDLQGTIIAMLTNDQIVGTGEVVFLDLNEDDGLEVGNRMFVVRRGDANPDLMDSEVGQDDRDFPARALGEVVIVDVGKDVSIGLITLAIQEMGAGDLVMMQKTP